MLTLYTTPVVYLFFDNVATKFAAWRGRKAPQQLLPPPQPSP
jgi:hypothetical protein